MERERPHPCNICGKKFHQMNQLRQHAVVHKPEEERPFGCYICGKKFNRLHHLKLHLMVHSGQSPHTCEVCGRTCNQLSDLKKHQMIHTGEKPHTCPICGKGFIQIGGMRRHVEKHKEKTLHACKICGKHFSKPGSLKKHVKCHENDVLFVCNICSKCFSTEKSLKNHETTHKKNKYICDKCGKTFKIAEGLEQHSLEHLNEVMPYQCTVCADEFFQLDSYKEHMEFHGIILSDPEAPDLLIPDNHDENMVEASTVAENFLSHSSNMQVSANNMITGANNFVMPVEVLLFDSGTDSEVSDKDIQNESAKCLPLEMENSDFELQETETRESMCSEIDEQSMAYLTNDILCEPDECGLDSIDFDGNVYTIVLKKPADEDLQELINSVS